MSFVLCCTAIGTYLCAVALGPDRVGVCVCVTGLTGVLGPVWYKQAIVLRMNTSSSVTGWLLNHLFLHSRKGRASSCFTDVISSSSLCVQLYLTEAPIVADWSTIVLCLGDLETYKLQAALAIIQAKNV